MSVLNQVFTAVCLSCLGCVVISSISESGLAAKLQPPGLLYPGLLLVCIGGTDVLVPASAATGAEAAETQPETQTMAAAGPSAWQQQQQEGSGELQGEASQRLVPRSYTECIQVLRYIPLFCARARARSVLTLTRTRRPCNVVQLLKEAKRPVELCFLKPKQQLVSSGGQLSETERATATKLSTT